MAEQLKEQSCHLPKWRRAAGERLDDMAVTSLAVVIFQFRRRFKCGGCKFSQESQGEARAKSLCKRMVVMIESWNLNWLRRVVRASGGVGGSVKGGGNSDCRSHSQSNQKTLDCGTVGSDLERLFWLCIILVIPPSMCHLNSIELFTSLFFLSALLRIVVFTPFS